MKSEERSKGRGEEEEEEKGTEEVKIQVEKFPQRDEANRNEGEKERGRDERNGKREHDEEEEEEGREKGDREREETEGRKKEHGDVEEEEGRENREEREGREKEHGDVEEEEGREKRAEEREKGEERVKEETERSEGPPKGVRFLERTAEAEGRAEMKRLEEYEQKLRRNTKEALELVDRLCELQQGQTAPATERIRLTEPKNGKGTDRNAELSKALAKGVHQMGERAANGGEKAVDGGSTEIGEGAEFDVESVSLSGRLLHSPGDCLLLPGHLLLLVDSVLGLSLLSLRSRQMIKNICPPAGNGLWRNAQCACLGESKSEGQSVLYVLLDHRLPKQSEGERRREANGTLLIPEGEFQRKCNGIGTVEANETEKEQNDDGKDEGGTTEYAQFICRFALPDMEMVDRIEAPKWLREQVVTQCRLCFVPQTECLYLVANTPNQGFLYELNIHQGKWTECAGTKRFRNYSDVHPFAVIGPVTELLLVETNRCYVQLLSLYGSNVVRERMVGLCERPGSLCVDERGNLFVFDRANSKVGLYSRTYLEKMGDVALVERANCRLSAREGVLAVMCGTSKELKLHRYSEEKCRREREW